MTSEKELIQYARLFDQAALAEIYDSFSPGLYRYALRLLGDTHQAEDCLSETFLRYLKMLRSNGGPDDHLQAYLYRIAHNWITDQYRRQPLPTLPLFDELESGEDELSQRVVDRIKTEEVRGALVRLSAEQRQVIVLKYLEGWENEAVAQILDKPVGAIKSLQHRAIDALRRMLLPKETLQEILLLKKEETNGTFK